MSRRTFGALFTNWDRSELPIPQRLLVAARNVVLRFVRRDVCCGHDGEPGC
ncbi:MAG: hypothetical protein HYX53_08175 [Chloroflexi bacterium]|nr:hypothetical protein [Chloroflexota bacterium]